MIVHGSGRRMLASTHDKHRVIISSTPEIDGPIDSSPSCRCIVIPLVIGFLICCTLWWAAPPNTNRMLLPQALQRKGGKSESMTHTLNEGDNPAVSSGLHVVSNGTDALQPRGTADGTTGTAATEIIAPTVNITQNVTTTPAPPDPYYRWPYRQDRFHAFILSMDDYRRDTTLENLSRVLPDFFIFHVVRPRTLDDPYFDYTKTWTNQYRRRVESSRVSYIRFWSIIATNFSHFPDDAWFFIFEDDTNCHDYAGFDYRQSIMALMNDTKVRYHDGFFHLGGTEFQYIPESEIQHGMGLVSTRGNGCGLAHTAWVKWRATRMNNDIEANYTRLVENRNTAGQGYLDRQVQSTFELEHTVPYVWGGGPRTGQGFWEGICYQDRSRHRSTLS